jgi:hypothetical protein
MRHCQVVRVAIHVDEMAQIYCVVPLRSCHDATLNFVCGLGWRHGEILSRARDDLIDEILSEDSICSGHTREYSGIGGGSCVKERRVYQRGDVLRTHGEIME